VHDENLWHVHNENGWWVGRNGTVNGESDGGNQAVSWLLYIRTVLNGYRYDTPDHSFAAVGITRLGSGQTKETLCIVKAD